MSISASTVEQNKGEQAQHQSDSLSSYISWASFQQEYLNREDGFKYEWLNGNIEKTLYTMDQTQAFIQRNLLKTFRNLLHNQQVEGEMLVELDLFFDQHHRRPDLVWLTDDEISQLANKKNVAPAFVIEVISTNDMINKVVHKMKDYRAGKVQVVWHIFPEHKEVHVYTGKQLEKMKIFVDDQSISAAPVLPDYKIKVSELFKI